jgi:hypothetical protein
MGLQLRLPPRRRCMRLVPLLRPSRRTRTLSLGALRQPAYGRACHAGHCKAWSTTASTYVCRQFQSGKYSITPASSCSDCATSAPENAALRVGSMTSTCLWQCNAGYYNSEQSCAQCSEQAPANAVHIAGSSSSGPCLFAYYAGCYKVDLDCKVTRSALQGSFRQPALRAAPPVHLETILHLPTRHSRPAARAVSASGSATVTLAFTYTTANAVHACRVPRPTASTSLAASQA